MNHPSPIPRLAICMNHGYNHQLLQSQPGNNHYNAISLYNPKEHLTKHTTEHPSPKSQGSPNMSNTKRSGDLPPPYQVDDDLPDYESPPSTPIQAPERTNDLDTNSVAALYMPWLVDPPISNSPVSPPRALTRAGSLADEEYSVGTYYGFLRSHAYFLGPHTARSTQRPAAPRFCRRTEASAWRRTGLKLCISFFLIFSIIVAGVGWGLYYAFHDVTGLGGGNFIPAPESPPIIVLY